MQKSPGTNVFLHFGKVTQGKIAHGAGAVLKVDGQARQKTASGHSSTHLLHKALRTVLGEHVRQAGSLVTCDRLRFDFTHSAAVSREDMEKIESLVNQAVTQNHQITTEVMTTDEATRCGALAFFEERYGESVRVVSMGDFSKELCGGTHAKTTGEIGFFCITSEGAVASGVRRFECLTGAAAVIYFQKQKKLLSEIAGALKAKPEDIENRISKLQTRIKELEKTTAPQGSSALGLMEKVIELSGFKSLAAEVEAQDPKAMREIGDRLKDQLGANGIIALAAKNSEGKAMLLVIVGEALLGRFKAGDLVGKMAAELGGRGGGRGDMAQAGGPHADKIPTALALFNETIQAGENLRNI
ncbi:MAG: DHHA1 domain-containing protein [Candidatus Adiutrix sp.]